MNLYILKHIRNRENLNKMNAEQRRDFYDAIVFDARKLAISSNIELKKEYGLNDEETNEVSQLLFSSDYVCQKKYENCYEYVLPLVNIKTNYFFNPFIGIGNNYFQELLKYSYICEECESKIYLLGSTCDICHKNIEPSIVIGMNLLMYLMDCYGQYDDKALRQKMHEIIKYSLPFVSIKDNKLPKMYRYGDGTVVMNEETCDKITNFYINEYLNSHEEQKITKITVKKLFNVHSYQFRFDKNYSILFGSNSIGKTTIFNLIEHLFIKNTDDVKNYFDYIKRVPFEVFKVEFSDGKFINVTKNANNMSISYSPDGFTSVVPLTFKNIELESDFIRKANEHYLNVIKLFPKFNYSPFFLFIKINTHEKISNIQSKLLLVINNGLFFKKDISNQRKTFIEQFNKSLRPSFLHEFNVSTKEAYDALNFFNTTIHRNIEYDNYALYFENIYIKFEQYIKDNSLDLSDAKIRNKKISEYFVYLSKAGIKCFQFEELFQSFYNYKYYFESFYYEEDPARKTIVYKDGSIRLAIKNPFSKTERNKYLEFDNLSSGEINIATMLYYLIFKTNKYPSIILIDEPEISLHVMWQKRLGEIIKEITDVKRGQVIIASHSPFIASGNEDNIVLPVLTKKDE